MGIVKKLLIPGAALAIACSGDGAGFPTEPTSMVGPSPLAPGPTAGAQESDAPLTVADLGGHPKPATDGHLKTGHHD